MRFKDCFHAPAIATGFIAVLVGYTGSAIIVFQAAQVAEESSREAAVITFPITASGVTLFGIGAAFRGLVAGSLALFILRKRK